MDKFGHIHNGFAHTRRARIACMAAACVVLALVAMPARAYVDLAPTLNKVINDATTISLVEVTEYNREAHAAYLKVVRTLKGPGADKPISTGAEAPPAHGGASIIHRYAVSDGQVVPTAIAQWVGRGAVGVLFTTRVQASANEPSQETSLMCIGENWYQVSRKIGADGNAETKFSVLSIPRPDLSLTYAGSVPRLGTAVEQMLAGRDAVITVVPHGAEGAASFDLALTRASLPGAVKLQRQRVNMKMPQVVMAVSVNAAYVLGQGPMDAQDLPEVLERLHSQDAAARAEAADDLRVFGKHKPEIIKALEKLLADESPRVRFAGAAALLKLTRSHEGAARALAEGLSNSDAVLRREAARAAGLAGEGGAPLVAKLAELLKDSDADVQTAALVSLSTLGETAAEAAPSVMPLLDDAALRIAAADALGRMGKAGTPALPKLAKMLNDKERDVQWAAVRAMSQIGGPGAHPAVEYMIKALPKAIELDAYNMMIYFSLLGPDARDALPAIRVSTLKNPVLPSSTQWAIEQNRLPWDRSNGGRGFRGPMGGGDNAVDISKFIYESYFHELKGRLAGSAKMFAEKIVAGTEGDVPLWGYKLLACGGADVLKVLTPHLADASAPSRERAVVAVGYMGPAAAAAKESLTAALAKAQTPKEKKLVEWAIRQVTVD